MPANPQARIVVRLEITPDAKEAIEEATERTGMTQVSLTSRVLQWFSRQSPTIQAAILGHLPAEIEADILKLMLQKNKGPVR